MQHSNPLTIAGFLRRRGAAARCLAILALLFTCAAQAGEVSHDHSQHGAAVECLFCKVSADTAMPEAGAACSPVAPAATIRKVEPVALLTRAATSPSARGPPAHS